ncbi:hypothetical protein [Amycolatopsis magusensis]|uniref:hypothetical protein n=1 Tax=Amycolatopsis magusensis TaxID=882444 RepID=UPI003793F939
MTRYENYRHEPAAPPCMARELARALGVPDTVALAVPDDRLIVIVTLDRPGGSLNGEQVVIGVDVAADVTLTGRAGERTTAVYLEGDFPAGAYERDADDDPGIGTSASAPPVSDHPGEGGSR